MKRAILVFCTFLWLAPVLGQEKVDLSIIHQIKEEAFANSKVMDHLFYLTDVNGPRLTGSPGFRAAADWAVSRLSEYGLKGAKREKWGPFGRGWSCTRFSAELLEPRYTPLIGFPLAWSPSTGGPVAGEPMLAAITLKRSAPKRNAEELQKFMEKYRGKLNGKIVMLSTPNAVKAQNTTASKRFTDAELAERAMALEPSALSYEDLANLDVPEDPRLSELYLQRVPLSTRAELSKEFRNTRNKLNQFLREEGVRMVISSDARSDGGTVFGEGAGSWDPKDPLPVPAIVLTPEHYNRIARLIDKKIPVRVGVDLQAQLSDASQGAFNVIAEIPGGEKKDELVMLGAHLDSWVGGTGATDNAAGCAVVMEAARILKTLDLKMDRTVRLALWGGEEQGLLGSKAYVKEHFADPETMALKPDHARLAGYFNVDNGSGKIRGIFLQGNDVLRPIFEAWLTPFKDLGVSTISIRNTGGTDHLYFDAVGLPGFQFIQDPLEYMPRTHHSNMDVYDHVQASDLIQASAVLASMVYHTATRDQMLPRKPLPKPKPKKQEIVH